MSIVFIACELILASNTIIFSSCNSHFKIKIGFFWATLLFLLIKLILCEYSQNSLFALISHNWFAKFSATLESSFFIFSSIKSLIFKVTCILFVCSLFRESKFLIISLIKASLFWTFLLTNFSVTLLILFCFNLFSSFKTFPASIFSFII